MLVDSGTYTGNGSSQAITTSVDATNALILIKGDAFVRWVFSTSDMATNEATNLDNATSIVNTMITAKSSSSFTVGSHADTNNNGTTFHWWVIEDDGGDDFECFTYTGDGGSSRNISVGGLGSNTPCFACVKQASAVVAHLRFSTQSGTNAFSWNSSSENSTSIIGLGTDQITVGTGANVNSATYYGFAFAERDDSCTQGSYTGNGSDNRNITSSDGFDSDIDPVLVFVRGSLADQWAIRSSTNSGDASFDHASGSTNSNRIQSQSTGQFQVGTDAEVNGSGTTYHFFAMQHNPAGSSANRVEGAATAAVACDGAADSVYVAYVSCIAVIECSATVSDAIVQFASCAAAITCNADVNPSNRQFAACIAATSTIASVSGTPTWLRREPPESLWRPTVPGEH